jgi:hypothetical protein
MMKKYKTSRRRGAVECSFLLFSNAGARVKKGRRAAKQLSRAERKREILITFELDVTQWVPKLKL